MHSACARGFLVVNLKILTIEFLFAKPSKVSSVIDRLPAMLPKGLDKVSQKPPPVSWVSSSQDVFSDQTSVAFVNPKNSTSLTSSNGMIFTFLIFNYRKD